MKNQWKGEQYDLRRWLRQWSRPCTFDVPRNATGRATWDPASWRPQHEPRTSGKYYHEYTGGREHACTQWYRPKSLPGVGLGGGVKFLILFWRGGGGSGQPGKPSGYTLDVRLYRYMYVCRYIDHIDLSFTITIILASCASCRHVR